MITNFTSFKSQILAHDGKNILATWGKVIETLNPSTWCDFTTAFGKLFLATENSPVYVYNGMSASETTARTSIGFKLQCKAITDHKGVLYAANIIEEDGAHPARIRWSEFGNPENFEPWGTENFQNFQDVGDVDEPVLRIISFNNDLVILKQNSIWVASGIAGLETGDIAPQFIQSVNTEFGLIGVNAVTLDADGIRFVSEAGLHKLDANYSVKKEDSEIWQIIDARPRNLWSHICIERDVSNGTLYLGIPKTKEENEEWYVQNLTRKWQKWTFGRNMNVVKCLPDRYGLYHTYFGDSYDAIYELSKNQRNDFAGKIPISCEWETGWIDTGKTTLIRSLELSMRQEGTFTISVDVYHDYSKTPYETKTINLDAGDAKTGTALANISSTANYENFVPAFTDLSGHARFVRFRFYSNVVNGRFRILNMKIGVIPRSGI